MIAAQIALYPLGTTDYEGVISAAVAALDHSALEVQVGEMGTLLRGPADRVWYEVRRLFEAAGGETVLVATFSNVCGCKARAG